MKEGNYKGYADPDLVVSVEEASRLLKRSDVIFVDTRNYWKYAAGHIPGAFNLELYAFHWVDTSERGIRAFVKQMEMLFSSLGIDQKKKVIFYTNNSGYDAARGVWLLNFLGHPRTSLLDGGLNLWKRRKLPLSKEDPKLGVPSDFVANPRMDEVITFDDLVRSVGSGRKRGFRILDTRSEGEYLGTFKRALKAGHIPGSTNIEWKRALRRDGTLKDATQLRKIYSGFLRDEKEGEIATYCQSGYRAAHSWLVLKLLGVERPRNYLGSWYEWGNNPRSVVTKATP